MLVNAWVACTFAIFSAISLVISPSNLIATPRHEYVFETIISRQALAIIYLVVAIVCSVGIVYPKTRWAGFIGVALLSAFWSIVGILPFLFDKVSQASILGTLSGVALTIYGITLAVLCYERYDKTPALPRNIAQR